MPARDKTGPLGEGPMTGRGFGFCGGGRARGFGMGFRRGFRRAPAAAQYSKEEEKAALREELELIKKRLEEIGE